MYSLVSAGVLAIDLARHPSGSSVADVVDSVLALTPGDLAALALVHPAAADVRGRVLARAGTAAMTTALRQVRDGLTGEHAGDRVVDTLTTALLGDLPDLHALLRRELPLSAAPPTVVQVVLDAVTAAWSASTADVHDLVLLRAPYAVALGELPVSLPRRPWSEQLTGLLEQVPHRSSAGWARSVAAHRRAPGQQRWSERMHDACWAVHHADRVHEVARAQLAAARALRLSGASTGPEAHAHGMVLTAAVQGVCAADLLDTRALLEPWQAGS